MQNSGVNLDDDQCLATFTPRYRLSGNDHTIGLVKKASIAFAFDTWNTNIVHLKVTSGGWDSGKEGRGIAYWESINTDNGSSISVSSNALLMDEDTCKNCNPRKQWDRVGVGSWVRHNKKGANARILYDDAYIAAGKNARAHIEIRDTPEFDGARKTVVAYPTSWTPTKIQAVIYKDNLPKKSYLYVIDSNGNASKPIAINWD